MFKPRFSILKINFFIVLLNFSPSLELWLGRRAWGSEHWERLLLYTLIDTQCFALLLRIILYLLPHVSVKYEHQFPRSRTYWWNQNPCLEVLHCFFLFDLVQTDLKLNFCYWLCCFRHQLNVTCHVSVIRAVPKRRRPARSIFDGFRDFQTETSEWI